MPSGKTHDAITFLLTPCAFGAAYVIARDLTTAVAVTGAFLFGGLMFGPDLDTASKQYSRWWMFRFLWLPYRMFFKHRSRWSHGLIVGTFLRVVYFIGAVTLFAFAAAYAWAHFNGDPLPRLFDFTKQWDSIGEFSARYVEMSFFLAVFIGMWAGAASHTFTDMAGSYIKTGRITEFL